MYRAPVSVHAGVIGPLDSNRNIGRIDTPGQRELLYWRVGQL